MRHLPGTGRVAAGTEIEPRYSDVTIRRWQDRTGNAAIHAESGLSFDDVAAQRRSLATSASPAAAAHA